MAKKFIIERRQPDSVDYLTDQGSFDTLRKAKAYGSFEEAAGAFTFYHFQNRLDLIYSIQEIGRTDAN